MSFFLTPTPLQQNLAATKLVDNHVYSPSELYLLVKMKFFKKINIYLQFDQKNTVKQVIGVFKNFLINPAKKILLRQKKLQILMILKIL